MYKQAYYFSLIVIIKKVINRSFSASDVTIIIGSFTNREKPIILISVYLYE